MATIDTKTFLTTKQFAERLGDGTKPDTIRKYCEREKIKGNKLGRDWFIPLPEFARFVRERQPVGRPPSK